MRITIASIGVVVLVLFNVIGSAQDNENIPSDLLPFPLELADTEQLEEARQCLVDNASLPGNLNTFRPQTACEWAILALAYSQDADSREELPSLARDAYSSAILRNSAIAFSLPIYTDFLSRLTPIIDTPLSPEVELQGMTLSYYYAGEGEQVDYQVTLENITSRVAVSGRSTVVSVPHEGGSPEESVQLLNERVIDARIFETFNDALYNFVPIEKQFAGNICRNFTVEWELVLQYTDGTELQISTYGSQVIPSGGPWQMIIDDQAYIQVDLSLFWAVRAITAALQLPEGYPMSFDCDEDFDLFGLAFPSSD
jgi:hypothetical protein